MERSDWQPGGLTATERQTVENVVWVLRDRGCYDMAKRLLALVERMAEDSRDYVKYIQTGEL